MTNIIIPLEFQSFLRLSREGDAEQLAPDLRDMDRREIAALSGNTPLEALRRGALFSTPALTFLFPENPAKIFGMGGVGQPGNVVWLLLHKDALRCSALRKRFGKISPQVLHWLLSLCPGGFMGNVTLPENTVILRWLRWLGARVDSISPDHEANTTGRELRSFVFMQEKENRHV